MKKVAHHRLFTGRTISHEKVLRSSPRFSSRSSAKLAEYGKITRLRPPWNDQTTRSTPLDRAHRPARVSRARPLDYRAGRLGRGGGECPRMADAARLTKLMFTQVNPERRKAYYEYEHY